MHPDLALLPAIQYAAKLFQEVLVFVVMALLEVNNNVNLLVSVIVVQIVDLLQFVEIGFNNPVRNVMMEIEMIEMLVPIIAH